MSQPTEPGFYWWRMLPTDEWDVARVFVDYDGQLSFRAGKGSKYMAKVLEGEWSSRLIPPGETP